MLPLFALAIFSSAFLLFLVQPMFSKVVLPFMGGGAAVWNTSVLFFQLVLLAGYLYAHVVSTRLGARTQVLVHAALFAVTLLLLPIEPKLGAPPPGASPVAWLLGLLALSIGAPFLLLSTTGPLLQRWFSRAGHRDSANPYFLYSASNAGSLLALLSYPVFVEPWLTLAGQRVGWSVGYVVVAGLVVACGWTGARGITAPVAPPSGGHSGVTPRLTLHWIVLAAIPSALMLAVTTWMTTDVAPVPLLWVIPLALYLLSFIFAFARRPRPGHRWWVERQPVVLVAATVLLFFGDEAVSPMFAPFHLVAFFVTAMVCHGELARLRPPPERLTKFYLCMSVGGALGGFFSAIVAPLVFDSIAEYPWLVVAACAVRPTRHCEERSEEAIGARWSRRPLASSASPPRNDVLSLVPFVVALLTLIFATTRLTGAGNAETRDPYWRIGIGGACGVMALALLRSRRRPLELAVGAGLVLVAGHAVEQARGNVVYAERNFYGERTVREVGPAFTLAHGTTTHGMQFADSARREIPLAYYHRGGPVGELFRSLPLSPLPLRVAVVGLGTGAIAAYGEEGDRFDFYEIDPAMERLARDPRWFSYLEDSEADVRVILGDGRLTMAEVPDSSYDLIFLDAFSSDAIPVHLLTREALAMFAGKLAPEGILAVHLSNRYLRLDRVVAAAADDLGLPARHRVKGTAEDDRPKGYFGSSWAALARDTLPLAPLPPTWTPLEAPEGLRGWTDDYSNVLSVFRWRR
ncbi:MAG TPA: fused MFS/spermidine synthase [Gemmatimonadales bacterium]|nr:fused MFS/spermidine synthase [Gemmatimonadales bacterium]